MRKKIICIATAIVMLFTLGACKKTESSSGSDGKDDVPPSPPAESYDYNAGAQADSYDEAFTEALLGMGDNEFTLSQLAGTDAEGRAVKTVTQAKPQRYVGIFYFMWLGAGWNYIYDISKILEANPGLEYDTVKNPLWACSGSQYYDASVSPQHAFHYFEEPFYGYYNSSDKWVIRRHLELLSMAGIDFLYLDFTNAGNGGVNLYYEATIALLDSILELQQKGYNVPKIVPICCNNTQSISTIKNVVRYVRDNYYRADNYKYKSCWFTADPVHNPSGKPLLAVYNDGSNAVMNSEEASDFWVRNVVWPSAPGVADKNNGFPWMDFNQPQESYGGVMNVSVAQHLTGSWSSEAFLANSKKNTNYLYRGRGATYSQKYAYQTDDAEMALYGANFIDQWKDVLERDDVWMVTVTGWNEWVAQKYTVKDPKGDYAQFVDTFNVPFSRDIEMMRDSGGYADNYWMLLCKYVREYKYGKSDKKSNTAMWKLNTVDFENEEAWNAVKATYTDFAGDATERNERSAGGVYTYTDKSNRNDISCVKIANDNENLYLYAKTKEPLSKHEDGDTDWMNVYISTGKKGGWEGYNFLINRNPQGNKTSIEALGTANGKITATVQEATAQIATGDDWIAYKIPLSALGVTAADEIGVKVCDNIFANKKTARNDGVCVFEFGDVMAFYGGGDCAPMGRLNYAYRMAY